MAPVYYIGFIIDLCEKILLVCCQLHWPLAMFIMSIVCCFITSHILGLWF